MTAARRTSEALRTIAVATYDTVAAATAASIPAEIRIVWLNGYDAAGDAPVARYVRTGSEPAHAGGKFQSADGQWWAISGPDLYVEQFGLMGDGVTDDLASLLEAEECRAALSAVLHFGPKNYYLSNPNAVAMRRPRWRGSEANATLITCDGASSACFFFEGTGGYTAGFIENITFWAPASRTTGWCLYFDGDATYQADEFRGRNVKITGTGSWAIPLYMSGKDRTSPQGLRLVSWTDLFIGRDTSIGIYADNCVQLEIAGGGIYGGTTNDLTVTSTHGSLSSADSMITRFKVNGDVVFDKVTSGIFQGICGTITLTANCSNVHASGVCGTVTNSGTSNVVQFA